MKTRTSALFAMTIGLIAAGCSNRVGVTNPEQPGPAIGRAVGTGVGTVVGNVAGAGVGVAEGTTAGVKTSFDNTQRIVRSWREETTADGRTIQVPVEYLVDKDGRVIRQIK